MTILTSVVHQSLPFFVCNIAAQVSMPLFINNARTTILEHAVARQERPIKTPMRQQSRRSFHSIYLSVFFQHN